MQKFTDITADMKVRDSRALLMNNDETIMSNSAAEIVPTTHLMIGRKFYNTAEKRFYTLVDDDTWELDNYERIMTQMSAKLDFNDLTTSGRYTQRTAQNATKKMHYPAEKPGYLCVTNDVVGTATQVYQTYHLLDNSDVFCRTKNGEAWGEWRSCLNVNYANKSGCAEKLEKGAKINGVLFDGSGDITIDFGKDEIDRHINTVESKVDAVNNTVKNLSLTVSNSVASSHGTQIFTSSSSWVAPAGVTCAWITAKAGGGGGGSGSTPKGHSGYNGGNGGTTSFGGLIAVSGGAGGAGGVYNKNLKPPGATGYQFEAAIGSVFPGYGYAGGGGAGNSSGDDYGVGYGSAGGAGGAVANRAVKVVPGTTYGVAIGGGGYGGTNQDGVSWCYGGGGGSGALMITW